MTAVPTKPKTMLTHHSIILDALAPSVTALKWILLDFFCHKVELIVTVTPMQVIFCDYCRQDSSHLPH